MTAKERLVELIKDSDIYIPSIDDDVAEDLADSILKEFVMREDVETIRLQAFKEWCRFAVKRMSYWNDEDLKESVDFRRGVEKSCSDMCVYFRTRTSDESSPYLENQAIEYAIKKSGMQWDSNRQRLSFYANFASYIKERIDNLIKRNGTGIVVKEEK